MERKCALKNDVLVSLFKVLLDFTNALKIVLVLVGSLFSLLFILQNLRNILVNSLTFFRKSRYYLNLGNILVKSCEILLRSWKKLAKT